MNVAGALACVAELAAARLGAGQRVVALPAVGDRVTLALDDEDGIVTKCAGGWISVRLDDGTVEKFRSTELRY